MISKISEINKIYNLIILGSGPAGLTAAIYSSRAKLEPLVVSGPHPGGQLMGTTAVENWPGEISIMGPDLMIKMEEHAKKFGASFLPETVTKVDFSNKIFKIFTDHNKELQAKSLIISTGAVPKKLNCPGEKEYWGKGVTTCAVCDGAFYKDLPVVIVGGGDTAVEDASFMTRFTDNITIVQNLDKLSASPIMQDRVLNNPKIKIIYNSTVSKILGDNNKVNSLEIKNLKTNNTQVINTSGLFIAIGFNPNTSIFKNKLDLDNYNYLKITNKTHTSVPGVFAAGDVFDYKYRQAITSAGSGCMAALDAEKYLSSL